MVRTIVETESGLRRATYWGTVCLTGMLLLVGIFWLSPGDGERLARSAGQLEAAARTLGEGESLGPRELGGLTFEDVYREDGVVFFQQGRFADEPYGYAWSPQGRLKDFGDEHFSHKFTHEHGRWYSWRGIT